MNKKVSIVIPVYNGSNYMRDAIDSALCQTYKNIEIIVVNDGSNDDGKTREIALSYGDKIRYFEKENGGVSTALNLGINNMTGDYFSWLSHDDIYAQTKIEKEIQILEAHGDEISAVYSDYAYLLMPDRQLRYKDKFSDSYGLDTLTNGSLATSLWLIHGCSLLIPKLFFEKFGLFDTRYRGVQDYVKWFDMFSDKKILYVDEVLVYSRMHSEQQSIYLGERYFQEYEELLKHAIDINYGKMEQGKEFDLQQIICLLIDRADLVDISVAMAYGKEFLSKCEQIKLTKHRQDKLKKKLGIKKETKVYIYGAGIRGKRIKKILSRRNIDIENFIDQNRKLWNKKIENVTCIKIEEVADKESIIIVSNLEYKDICISLGVKGYKHVYEYEKYKGEILLTPFLSDDMI